MRKYFQQFISESEFAIVVLGVLSALFILVTTLNATLAVFILGIFVNLAIFQRSFHLGWMFTIVIILVFPSIDIVRHFLSLEELMILILGVISIVIAWVEKGAVKLSVLFYSWFILAGVTMFVIFQGRNFIFNNSLNQIGYIRLLIFFAVYPVVISSFQYFFQTAKRLEKFFMIIVAVASLESVFSLLVMIFGLNFSDGVGASREIFNNVFSNNTVIRQATGFLGSNLFTKLGGNTFSTLLIVSIPLTVGLWLLQKNNLSIFSKEKSFLAVDDQTDSRLKLKIKRKEYWFNFLLMISFVCQTLALLLTFSYVALLVLGVSILMVGILTREKRIILVTAVLLFVFAVVLPGIEPALIIQPEEYLFGYWHDLHFFKGIKSLWRGFEIIGSGQIYNSYLLIFSKLGFIGLGLFIFGLWRYFKEIRSAYLQSDGFKRIWLMIILAIFIEFVVLGLFSNLFFIGPGALLFWLLYGAVQNLKSGGVEFRLTETGIDNK